MSVHILCGVHKALYKILQKTGTKLPYFLEYGMSGQIVDQKRSVTFRTELVVISRKGR